METECRRLASLERMQRYFFFTDRQRIGEHTKDKISLPRALGRKAEPNFDCWYQRPYNGMALPAHLFEFSGGQAKEKHKLMMISRDTQHFMPLGVCPGRVCHGECESLLSFIILSSTQLSPGTEIFLIPPSLHPTYPQQTT